MELELEIEEKEMSFVDHLEELRWHIIRSVISIFIFTIVAWIFQKEIFGDVIMGPSKPNFWTNRMLCKLSEITGIKDLCFKKIDFILQSREVSGQFMMALTQSIMVGLLFSFPYFFWEIWRFIRPGLKKTEIQATNGVVFWVSLLFFIGVCFGYFLVSPMTINFLASFKLDESIQNQYDINDYMSLLSTLALSCGITFQMPMITYALTKVGIISPTFMKNHRRHAFVIFLIIAAIITPSPDMISQLLVTAPLIGLYEISIKISSNVVGNNYNL